MKKCHFMTFIFLYIYNMKRLKNNKNKRIRISISISPEIHSKLEENTTNRSRYIEFALFEYFKKCELDISKIKL